MYSELEKIDIIRDRFELSYEEARNALNVAQGDVVTALALIEHNPPKKCRADLLTLGAELVNEVQKLNSKPIKKLRFKYGSQLIAETPLALTAAAAMVVGIAAVLITKLVIEVDKGEEEATA